LGIFDFLRIYVGIGRPSAGRTVVEHVLGRPEDGHEREALEAGIVRATDALMLCSTE
jgi:PTH1 family peptidyl-tRNA hydrolase